VEEQRVIDAAEGAGLLRVKGDRTVRKHPRQSIGGGHATPQAVDPTEGVCEARSWWESWR